MNTKMYVGNLPFEATETEVSDLFSEYGAVSEVSIIMDRFTQRPRGFAFVTMESREDMEKAIDALDGKNWLNRSLAVNEARPREDRPAHGGGGGGGGGNRGGGPRGGGGGRGRGNRW